MITRKEETGGLECTSCIIRTVGERVCEEKEEEVRAAAAAGSTATSKSVGERIREEENSVSDNTEEAAGGGAGGGGCCSTHHVCVFLFGTDLNLSPRVGEEVRAGCTTAPTSNTTQ
eukprot:TRINITY_DN67614_c2_g1_i2.p1 TRINITY_DN67614_c2_g1~~TRINITY_DN67614_c2_g1_i2.p1  ORF type:complete len:116 (-),score=20.25 TRINITY_DN67614_c2_g1_i2:692-1039(-)